MCFREVVLSWYGIILGFTKHNRGLISIPSSTVHVFSPRFAHTKWFFRMPSIVADLSGMSVVVLVLLWCHWRSNSTADLGGTHVRNPRVRNNTTQEGNALSRNAQCNANALDFRSNQRKAEGSKHSMAAGRPARVGPRFGKKCPTLYPVRTVP